ncbi:MAG: hypothetical protein ABGZ23_05785 [Fuerstiella sp.]
MDITPQATDINAATRIIAINISASVYPRRGGVPVTRGVRIIPKRD